MRFHLPYTWKRTFGKVNVYLAIALILLASNSLSISAVVQKAQFTRAPNRLVDERIRRILESLEADNPLRFALERKNMLLMHI